MKYYINKYYKLANEQDMQDGLTWYNEAHEFCKEMADTFNVPLNKVAAVCSILSVQTLWSKNKLNLISFLESYHYTMFEDIYERNVNLYTKNVQKAIDVFLSNEPPETFWSGKSGHKTLNFYFNILDTSGNHVTIDTHIANLLKINLPKTTNQYKKVVSLYQKEAKKLGILPHQLQAINWLTYKRLK